MPLRPDMTMKDYLRILSERKWLIAMTFFFVLLGAAAYIIVTPKQYKSSTTILVIPQRTPETYVQSTVAGTQDRLATLQQEITSRTRLMKVVEELGLFPEMREAAPQEVVIEEMNGRIGIEVDRDPREQRWNIPEAETFSLSFLHEDPELAMRTASRLASLFIEEKLKIRERQAVGTSKLLESQLQETKARLEAQEEQVRQYKLRHAGELPQEMQANLGNLQRLQDELRINAGGIQAAEQRKIMLQAQLGLIERGAQAVLHKDGKVEVDISEDSTQALIGEINARRSQLADLTAKYTNEYPEVIRVRNELRELEKRLAELPAAVRSAQRGESQGKDRTYVPLAGRQLQEFRQVKAQIAATDAEIQGLKREGEGIRRNISEIQAKVEQAPRRDQEMIALTRDYDNLRKRYDDLLNKKTEADISQDMEKRQSGDRFQILDPANLPEEPFKPQKRKVLMLALLLASGLGFGGAIGLEWMDPTLRGSRDFRHFFDLKVFASIPELGKARSSRYAARWVAILGLFLLLLAGVTSVVWIYGERIRTMLNL